MDQGLTNMLIFFLILLITLFGFRKILDWALLCTGKTNIPGVEGMSYWPIVGNAWGFVRAGSTKDIWDNLLIILKAVGLSRAKSFWLWSKLVIVVKDPIMIEVLLKSTKAVMKDPYVYGEFNKLVDGIFSRNGKGWSDLRRHINKILHQKIVLDNYLSVFEKNSEKTCTLLEKHCGQETFDIMKYSENYSFSTILETAMGVPASNIDQLGFNYDWAKSVVSVVFAKLSNPLYKIGWLFGFSQLKITSDKLKDEINSFGQKVIACRSNILAEKGLSYADPDFEPECYIDFTVEQAKNENIDGSSMPLDLVTAGYETTAVVISSACLYLAMHPEYQEKVYQEQLDIMGDNLRPPTTDEVAKMDYLWMVIRETLRHTGVPHVVRRLSSDIIIDGYVFPEGATLFLSMYSCYMNPDYWVKTGEFYPDNFLSEHVSNRPRGAFLPFGAGPRVCPGKTYAEMSMKIFLSTLLRRFKLTTSLEFSDMEYMALFMVESAKGYPVCLERRT